MIFMGKKLKTVLKLSKSRELLEKMRNKVLLSAKEQEELQKRVWVERLMSMADIPSTVDPQKFADICDAVAEKIFEKGF